MIGSVVGCVSGKSPLRPDAIHASARIELLSTLSIICRANGSTLRRIIPQLTDCFCSNLSEALAKTLEQLRYPARSSNDALV
jgi:hypothetical protein